MTEKTLTEQIESVRRELSIRQDAYPRWVDAGRLNRDVAEHEIDCMKSVLATLVAVSEDSFKLG